jgi:tetratricopeptide (TPR) repeat protein
MMTEEQRMDRFESYLKGAMSKSERESFDSELEVDQSLREELAAHKNADSAIAYLNRKELKRQLESIDEEDPFVRTQTRIRKILIRVAVAASIVLLAGFGIVFTTGYFSQETSLADLSEEYFAPTQAESFRGSDDGVKRSYEAQMIQADLLYQKGEYEKAIAEYKRLSLIDNTLNDLAEWNLVMSYLLSESHQTDCEEILNRIASDTTHMYYERALKLQKEL